MISKLIKELRRVSYRTAFILVAILPAPLLAEIAIITHPSNPETLDVKDISRIFTGKAKAFPNGNQAIPLNQAEGSPVTEEFNKKVLNKSASQIKAYWSKLVFTGKGTPPKEIDNAAEIISLVAANPNFIGYVDASLVDGSVKVVATF